MSSRQLSDVIFLGSLLQCHLQSVESPCPKASMQGDPVDEGTRRQQLKESQPLQYLVLASQLKGVRNVMKHFLKYIFQMLLEFGLVGFCFFE